MATLRYYLSTSNFTNGWASCLDYAQAAATRAGGWVVGTGLTNSSEFTSGATDRASTTFVANTVPDGTLDLTLKDALQSPIPLNGTFAAGNWEFRFAVQSPTQGGAADGQIVFRLFKADADGANATEITAGQQTASLCTNVSSVDLNSTLTISLGAFSITNQHLYIQLAWKRTGAGGMTTTNIRLRTGVSATVGTTFLTADFTEAPPTLVRVQETGKVEAVAPTASVTLTFPSPPTVGNAIVVLMTGTSGSPMVFAGATDSYGNVYSLVQERQITADTRRAAAILVCKKVEAAGTGFTITVHGSTTDHAWCGSAVEIGGLAGSEQLGGVAAIGTSGSGTTNPGAGITAITGEGLLAGALVLGGNTTSIAVETLDPAWSEHHESLTGVPGESNTRITNLAAGNVFVNWTTGTAGTYGAVFAEFKKQPFTVPDKAVTTQPVASTEVVQGPTLAVGAVSVTSDTLASTAQTFVPTVEVEAPSGGLIVTDPCSGAAGTLLPGWTRFLLNSDLQYDGAGKMMATVGGFSPARWTGDTFSADQYSQAEHNGMAYAAVGTRMDGTTTLTGYFMFWAGNVYGNGLNLQRYVNGAQATLQDFGLLYGSHTLRLESEGDVHRCYVDDVQVGTDYTDATIASGAPGVSVYNGGQGVTLDNIELGDLGAAGPSDQSVSGASIASTATLYAPTGVPQAVAVGGPTRATTLQLFAAAITVGAVAITGGTRPLTSQTFAPTVVPQAVTITAAHRPTTISINVPTVVPQAVAITTAHRASTIAVNAPTLAPGPVSITTATRPLTSQVNAPTVATGPVSVTTGTIAATQVFQPSVALAGILNIGGATMVPASQAFAPTVLPQAIGITAGTRSTTIVVFAPVVSAQTTGATIGSGSGTFAPTVAATLTTAHRATTIQVFIPAVAAAGATAVGLVAIPAGSVLTGPSLTVGPVAVTLAHVASTAVVNLPIVSLAGVTNVGTVFVASTAIVRVPTVTTGPVSLTAGTRPTTLAVNAPSLTVGPVAVGSASIATTVQVRVPSLTVGPASVTAAHRATTAQVFVPIVGLAGVTNVGTGTVGTTLVVRAPTLAVGAVTVVGGTCSPTTVMFAPVVTRVVSGATVGAGSGTFAPTVAATLITAHRAATSQTFLPSVAAAGSKSVGTAYRTTTIALYGVTVTRGAVTVESGTRPSTAIVHAPRIATLLVAGTVGSTSSLTAPSLSAFATIGTGARPTSIQMFAPVVVREGGISTAHRPTTVIVRAPAVAVSAVTIDAGHIANVGTLFGPSLGTVVRTAPLPTTAQLFGVTLTTGAVEIQTATIPSGADVFAISLSIRVVGGTIGSTVVLYPHTLEVSDEPPAAFPVTVTFTSASASVEFTSVSGSVMMASMSATVELSSVSVPSVALSSRTASVEMSSREPQHNASIEVDDHAVLT